MAGQVNEGDEDAFIEYAENFVMNLQVRALGELRRRLGLLVILLLLATEVYACIPMYWVIVI